MVPLAPAWLEGATGICISAQMRGLVPVRLLLSSVDSRRNQWLLYGDASAHPDTLFC